MLELQSSVNSEIRMYKLLYGGKYDNTNKLNTITNNPNHNPNK